MRTQVVLIDFENVQPDLLPALQAAHIQVRIFIGPTQHKIAADTVLAVQALGPRAQFIRVSKPGKEALDLQLAYYLGRLENEFPGAFFHVISKDQGFASLVDHLNLGGAHARLSQALGHLSTAAIDFVLPPDLPGRVHYARNWLKSRPANRPANRPASRKTLLSSLEKSAFQKAIDADAAQEVLAQLIALRLLKLNGEKVVYLGALDA